MVKNKHKHFNPDEHEVNVKMAKGKINKFMKKYGFWIGLILIAFVLGVTLF